MQRAYLSRADPDDQPCVFDFHQYDTFPLAYRDAADDLEVAGSALLRQIHAFQQPSDQNDGREYEKQAEDDLHDAA